MKGRVRIAHSEHLEIRPVDVSSSAINSWYLRRLYVRLEEVSVEGVCKHRARVAPLAEQCSGGGGGGGALLSHTGLREEGRMAQKNVRRAVGHC